MALSIIPEDDLQSAAAEAIVASTAAKDVPVVAQQDALARQLMLWFKRDFFSWVCPAARPNQAVFPALAFILVSMSRRHLQWGSQPCCCRNAHPSNKRLRLHFDPSHR